MRVFAVAFALMLTAQQALAVEVKLQGVQHLQTVNVVYSDLEKGKEYFSTFYG